MTLGSFHSQMGQGNLQEMPVKITKTIIENGPDEKSRNFELFFIIQHQISKKKHFQNQQIRFLHRRQGNRTGLHRTASQT